MEMGNVKFISTNSLIILAQNYSRNSRWKGASQVSLPLIMKTALRDANTARWL